MKLLYITGMYPSERNPQYCAFIHNQVKALIRNGVEITVVKITVNGSSSKAEYDGVEVVDLKYKDRTRTILYPFIAISLFRKLKKFVKLQEYDIVYVVHSPANILYFGRFLSRRCKKPLVVHYRGFNVFNEYNETKTKGLFLNQEKIKRNVVLSSDLSIGVSKKVIDVIKKEYPQCPAAVVYNGVDTQSFSEKIIRNDDVFKIICVANLIPIKGHKFLFEAINNIHKKYPDIKVKLEVIGAGFYEKELKQFVENNGIKDIEFKGVLPHSEVALSMQRADILVLPSVYEACANVCFEAMACHLPVVIFSGQGTEEIMENGVSGMIAEKGDVSDLQSKIERLMFDDKLRESVGENAFNRIKQYTWDKSAKCIIENLNKILK